MKYYKCTINNTFYNYLSNNANNGEIHCDYIECSLSDEERMKMREGLNTFKSRWRMYYDSVKSNMYYEFMIPKHSGGMRHITAPKDGPASMFTNLQEMLGTCFMNYREFATAHKNAYAYIKNRWCRPAVKKHQDNNSEWFCHFDLNDFFGSTTLEYTMRMLKMVYPFGPFMGVKEDADLLEEVLDIAFLNNGLPQGTQVSPMLSNIVTIPFDFILSKALEEMEEEYIYTRYADDLIISCKNKFDYKLIQERIEVILSRNLNAPYTINNEKTSFKRNKGRSNFILGMQLNQDNDITIGRKRKREIRWMLHSLFTHPENWNIQDLQSLAGVLNYFKCVEPEVYELTMRYYNNKYNCNVVEEIYDKINN